MAHPNPDNEATFREITIPSTLHDAKTPEQEILKDVEHCGYCQDARFAIKLALEEAMTNAVKHGNAGDQSKQICIRYAVNAERAVIIIRDDGPGFLPGEVPDPTSPDRLSLPTGRGIMLMRAYMDEVQYRKDGAEVYLVKHNR